MIKPFTAAVLPLKSLLMPSRIWHILCTKKPMLQNLGAQHEFCKPLFVPLNDNIVIFRGVYPSQLSYLFPPRNQKGSSYSIRIKAKEQSLCGKDFRHWSRQVCQIHLQSYIGKNLTKRVRPLIKLVCCDISAHNKIETFSPTQKSLPQNRVKAPAGSTIQKKFSKNSTRASGSFFEHSKLCPVPLLPP